ncbi:uncharacterized protein LOC111084116 isoform X2 [Limulus polyphemus]|uniref:Uncharacterized protein LOC111084116 isoform X1 n=1 Tax=Limulus polyphemus TaxID=6850 RepID=A0ABM1RZ10_LIMPO|nr:uncharacterized protein LOC111084116 isoform X1 [Limulus polyphemus]XP_022236615.1 uncharacterized protein LOC111084116 isoform X2 [Limulus polyphemus]
MTFKPVVLNNMNSKIRTNEGFINSHQYNTKLAVQPLQEDIEQSNSDLNFKPVVLNNVYDTSLAVEKAPFYKAGDDLFQYVMSKVSSALMSLNHASNKETVGLSTRLANPSVARDSQTSLTQTTNPQPNSSYVEVFKNGENQFKVEHRKSSYPQLQTGNKEQNSSRTSQVKVDNWKNKELQQSSKLKKDSVCQELIILSHHQLESNSGIVTQPLDHKDSSPAVVTSSLDHKDSSPAVVTQPLAHRDSSPVVVASSLAHKDSSPAVVTQPLAHKDSSPAVVTQPLDHKDSSPAVVASSLAHKDSSPAVVTQPLAHKDSSPVVVASSLDHNDSSSCSRTTQDFTSKPGKTAVMFASDLLSKSTGLEAEIEMKSEGSLALSNPNVALQCNTSRDSRYEKSQSLSSKQPKEKPTSDYSNTFENSIPSHNEENLHKNVHSSGNTSSSVKEELDNDETLKSVSESIEMESMATDSTSKKDVTSNGKTKEKEVRSKLSLNTREIPELNKNQENKEVRSKLSLNTREIPELNKNQEVQSKLSLNTREIPELNKNQENKNMFKPSDKHADDFPSFSSLNSLTGFTDMETPSISLSSSVSNKLSGSDVEDF